MKAHLITILIWLAGLSSALADNVVFPPGGGGNVVYPNFNILVDTFGADPTGVTDSTAGFLAAYNYVDAHGGGFINGSCGATYTTSTGMIFGNGSASAASGIHNRIAFKGCGIGMNTKGNGQVTGVQYTGATTIKYTGVLNSTACVVAFHGPMYGVGLEDVLLDANDLAGSGVCNFHVAFSNFKNITVANYTQLAYLSTTWAALPPGVGYGSCDNTWINANAFDPANSTANGMLLTSGQPITGAISIDSCKNQILGGTIVYGGSSNAYGIEFYGADNNIVLNTDYIPYGSNTGGCSVAFVQWPAETAFPLENNLTSVGAVQPPCGVSGTGGNSLQNFELSDGAGIPHIANVWGTTNTGVSFGDAIYTFDLNGYGVTIKGDVISANASGTGHGYIQNDGAGTPTISLTRQGNDATVSGYGGVGLAPGAVSGPSSSYSLYATTTYVAAYQPIYTASTGAQPTLSSCGTSPSISSRSGTNSGSITTGTGSPTSCTATFPVPFPNQAYCTVTAIGNYTGLVTISAESGTSFTIGLSIGVSNQAISYTCFGN